MTGKQYEVMIEETILYRRKVWAVNEDRAIERAIAQHVAESPEGRGATLQCVLDRNAALKRDDDENQNE